MGKFTRMLFISVLISVCIQGCRKGSGKQNPEPQKTNIVYILADDLGYGDVGAYGQEKIETPNIDRLAKNGMQFSQHYSG